jgi:hypothetical protein
VKVLGELLATQVGVAWAGLSRITGDLEVLVDRPCLTLSPKFFLVSVFDGAGDDPRACSLLSKCSTLTHTFSPFVFWFLTESPKLCLSWL